MSLGGWLRPGGVLSVGLVVLAAVGLMATGVTREVPVGQLSGLAVIARASEVGLPGADVILDRVTQDGFEGRSNWRTRTDEGGRFSFRQLPAGTYRVNVFGKAHSQTNHVVVVPEGGRASTKVALKPASPSLAMNAGSRVYLPSEEIKVRLDGVSQDAAVEYVVYSVPAASIEGARSVSDLLYAVASNRSRSAPEEMARMTRVAGERREIGGKDIEGVFVEEHALRGLPGGVYLLRAQVGELVDYAWLTVTRIALVTKAAGSGGEAFVCDLSTGAPRAGVPVWVVSGRGKVAQGVTGADGRVAIGGFQGQTSGQVLVAAGSGEDSAYTWFFADGRREGGRSVAHLTTDRPVYRPGDRLRFKWTWRMLGEERDYSRPGPWAVDLAVLDPDGETVKAWRGEMDDWGTVHGEVELPEYGGLGGYQVRAVYAGMEQSEWVPVAEYRKPWFDVQVTTERAGYVRGDVVVFRVKCTSFTGEPVAGAPVEASLSRALEWSGSPFDAGWDAFADEEGAGWEGDYLESLKGVTDENGEVVFRVDTGKRSLRDEFSDLGDATYTLVASAADAGGRFYEGRGRVRVSRGEMGLSAQFGSYLGSPGSELELEVVSSGVGGKGVWRGPVKVEFGREQWTASGQSFLVEGVRNLTVGADGTARARFTPKRGGSYLARVVAVDGRGNRVASEAYVWVTGSADEGVTGRPMVRVLLDKDRYEPGDVAKLVLQGGPGAEEGSVWLTVEAEGILRSEIVRLRGGEAVVEVPVTAAMAPNVEVSACLVAGKRFGSDSRAMRVGLGEQSLSVKVTPSTEVAAPGDTVRFAVETLDGSGRPVAADVSLGVVDEGVYRIKRDTSDPAATFYPRRWSNVRTAYSFPEIYLDGEDKGGPANVRVDFRDTAGWEPAVRTGEDGRAEVAVRLPDNLTSWRATATAVSMDTRVGKGVSSVVAKKDLMARLSAPAFFTQDDEQVVAGTVTNSTAGGARVKVELAVEGLEIEGERAQTVEVPAGESRSVSWRVVARQAGVATMRLLADAGGASDGMEIERTVAARAEEGRSYWVGRVLAGSMGGTEVQVPEALVGGEVQVTVSGSLLGGLESSLEELVDFPYGCVEQTMSRFVPAVVVGQYLRQTGTVRPELEAKIGEVTRRSLARISELESSGGGWGWFTYDEAEPRMTALVLRGLGRVREAGVSVPARLERRGREAAMGMLKASDWRKRAVELAPLALAVGSGAESERVLSAVVGMADKDVPTAVLAEIAAEVDGALGERAFARLGRRALSGGATLSFGDAFDNAAALRALSRRSAGDGRARRVMQTLMATRQGRGWGDTWRTGVVVQAAVDYLRSAGAGEEAGEGVAVVLVGGEERGRVTVSPGGGAQEVVVAAGLLSAGANRVEVRFEGSGGVDVAVEGRTLVYAQRAAAVSRPAGFTLKREYVGVETVRLEDGTVRLLPGKAARTRFRSGEVFRVRLTLTTRTALEFVAIEDPLPSNARIVDADKPEPGFEWGRWWSYNEFRDDRAVFFETSLAAGTHVIEYAVRAEAEGVGVALPARAYPMYQRDVLATTGQGVLEVRK